MRKSPTLIDKGHIHLLMLAAGFDDGQATQFIDQIPSEVERSYTGIGRRGQETYGFLVTDILKWIAELREKQNTLKEESLFLSDYDEEKKTFVLDYVLAARNSGRVTDLNSWSDQYDLVDTAISLYDLTLDKTKRVAE